MRPTTARGCARSGSPPIAAGTISRSYRPRRRDRSSATRAFPRRWGGISRTRPGDRPTFALVSSSVRGLLNDSARGHATATSIGTPRLAAVGVDGATIARPATRAGGFALDFRAARGPRPGRSGICASSRGYHIEQANRTGPQAPSPIDRSSPPPVPCGWHGQARACRGLMNRPMTAGSWRDDEGPIHPDAVFKANAPGPRATRPRAAAPGNRSSRSFLRNPTPSFSPQG